MSVVRWLHLSDFHSEGERYADWFLLWRQLPVIKIDFIVFTGDLRNFRAPDFHEGLEMLQELSQRYSRTAKELFLVPGNHDVDPYPDEEEKIKFEDFAVERLQKIENSTRDIVDRNGNPLTERFSQYSEALTELFEGEKYPFAQVYCRTWKNKVNLIHLNTALLSISNSHMEQIVDTPALAALKVPNPELPSLVLAHHSFHQLSKDQRSEIKNAFQNLNVRAYLHGDLHRTEEDILVLKDGREVPCLASPALYRNPPQGYGQTGVYLYEWDLDKPQGKVKITHYQWTDGRWEEKKSPVGSFSMQDIRKGLWKESYFRRTQGLESGMLPGISYQPKGCSLDREEYDNTGDEDVSPMMKVLQRHKNEKYFQLVGKGKQSCGGTGKTSTLLNLAAALTDPEGEQTGIVPLYFYLKSLYGIRSKKYDGKNRILAYAAEQYGIERGEEHLQTLFLLDGFNEITGPSNQAQCLSDIQEIIQDQFPNDGIIITSREPLDTYIRLWEYGNFFDERQLEGWSDFFRSCYVKQLTKQQIDRYICEPKPAPDDHIWSILDTPFYLTIYRHTELGGSGYMKRWVTPAFREHLATNTPDKATLMLQMLLREVERFGVDEESVTSERKCFLLTKVLPCLGYRQTMRDLVDVSLRVGPKLEFDRKSIYFCTYACLSACLDSENIWPEFSGQYADKLEMAWDDFCMIYQNDTRPTVSMLTKAIPYSTYLFGLLDYENGKTYFYHDNYRDFFAAFHIANVVYALSRGLELERLSAVGEEVFLLQLEFFDHSILLDAVSILSQYFGLSLNSASEYQALTRNIADSLSQMVLYSILIRLLDAQIQHIFRISGSVLKSLQMCRLDFYQRFAELFQVLEKERVLVRKYYGLFYGYVLAMLARAYRDPTKGNHNLMRCAGYAMQTAQAEKRFCVPKADGYLQLGLCINACMEGLLNGELEGQLKIPYDAAIAEEVREALRLYCQGQEAEGVSIVKKYLFKTWSADMCGVLQCARIFRMMLDAAYERYQRANSYSVQYREIARFGFVSKAYLILAAIGTSGGALNVLAQMLINQADQMESDPQLSYFQKHPHDIQKQQDASVYSLDGEEHFTLAYQVLQVVCGIRRGNQPYSHLKMAELVLKGVVSVPDDGQWLETSLNKVIAGDQSMGFYWKGRYFLQRIEKRLSTEKTEADLSQAITSFQATGALEYPYGKQKEERPVLQPFQWLSAIELLAFPDRVCFQSPRDQVYQAILEELYKQVAEIKQKNIKLKNERYRLRKMDVCANLSRFQRVVSKYFPGEKCRAVEALWYELQE